MPARFTQYVPILSWLPSYDRSWLRTDILAGLTTAAVVIPQAIAYATIAGLPVQAGLYASLTPMIVYAMLGTSRVLSVSVTSTLALLTATVLAATVPGGDPTQLIVAAGTLAFLVGLLLLAAGLLRLGFLANFISAPVLTGFKAGIGLVIAISQIGKALGISVPKGGVIQTLVDIVEQLGQASWASIAVTAIVLAVMIVLPRIDRRLPASLIAIAVGMGAAALLNRAGADVALVGQIPLGLPSLQLPDLSLFRPMLLAAAGIALMSFTESIAAGRAFADPDDPKVNADQELIALGAANVAGGLFQTFPGGGGTSQTAVNREAGAKSQVAALSTASVAALTLLVLAPLVGRIPEPALAAVVLVAATGLIKISEFRAIAQYRTTELVWAIAAAAGVIFLGTLEGILLAVGLSLAMLIRAANHPPVYIVGRDPKTGTYQSVDESPDAETWPGLLIVRTEGRLTFASVPHVREQVQSLVRENSPRVLVLECSAVPDIEYTAMQTMADAHEKAAASGVAFWLAGLNPDTSVTISNSPLGEAVGDRYLFPSVQAAVDYYVEHEQGV